MTNGIWRRQTATQLTVALLALGLTVGCKKGPNFAEVRAKADDSAQKATQYLVKQQLPDGTYDNRDTVKVGLTALAVVALMDQNAKPDDPNVQRAMAFVASQQKEDGSIRIQEQIENYETALSALALKKTGNKVYDDAMKKAQAYLARLQRGASDNVTADDLQYGGIGYGRRKTADLSNTQFALEALRATELGADAETFKRAVTFIERCQNLQKVNKQPYATNDGGFMYAPAASLANPAATGSEARHSYGSMTYAGLLSFSYCDVPRDDPRVKAALDWLTEHYTLDENPGMGKKGLYYYYMVMAKALSAYNEKYLVDKKGVKHYWAADLANKLVELQNPDGSWVNTDKTFMEDNRSLVTAYCMIALNRCRPFLMGK
jgi:squalene-hopene/tetraprenyl-beta-curcumene cyclase